MDHLTRDERAQFPLPYAIYAPPKQALPLARCVEHTLLACGPSWLPDLPEEYRRRAIRLCLFAEAGRTRQSTFVKPIQHGLFPSSVYAPGELAKMKSIPLDCPVLMAQPVVWKSEFRYFVASRRIVATSCYRYEGQTLESLDDRLRAPNVKVAEAERFCQSLLSKPEINIPAGVVIDVGEIKEKGWAVIEANEAWNSSIYTCSPGSVLEALLASCSAKAEGASIRARRRVRRG